MSNKNKLTASVTAAALLLLGGGSYALWSQTAQLDAVPVQSGTLGIALEDATYFDASVFRGPSVEDNVLSWEEDEGTLLNATEIDDPTAFLFSPEDRVLVAIPVTVTLEGTNLAAKVESDVAAVAEAHEGFTLSSKLVSAESALGALSATGAPEKNFIASEGDTQHAWVVLDVYFDADGTDHQLVGVEEVLDLTRLTEEASPTVTVTQVRE